MHSSHIRKTLQAPLTGLLCLALVLPPAWAQTPDLRLSDLVNQGSDYARRELRSRSFVFIHADQRGFVPKGGVAERLLRLQHVVEWQHPPVHSGRGLRRPHPVPKSDRRRQLPLTPAVPLGAIVT